MQNKGFVKVFAVLLTLVCVFYLSFSFVTRHYTNKAKEFAKGDVKVEQDYLDSLANEKVFFGNWTLKKFREMEIEKNDSAIFANIGVMPVTYCYPYNYKTDEIVELASKNRVGTRTRQISIGSKSTPQRFAKWLDDLLKKEEWGVGMTHGINYGYDAFKEPSLFWQHLDKVKSLEDKIWVGTFREVAAYIRERDDIQLKVLETKKGLTITPEMTLNRKLFTEPLTMVVEGREVRRELKGVFVKQGKKRLPIRIAGDKLLFDFNPYAGKIKVSFR